MSLADLRNKEVIAATESLQVFAAEFNEAASSVEERLSVIIPVFSIEKTWGPCRWMPRVDDVGDTVLPVKGDPCAVVFAESADSGMPDVWVVAWWPG